MTLRKVTTEKGAWTKQSFTRTVSENRWCGIVDSFYPVYITFLEVARSFI
jgi:hypothetical protein